MIRAFILLAIVSCVTSFSLRMAAEGMSKSVPFLKKSATLEGMIGGEAEFDPLGFSETFDVKWLREAELKHGRVSMLAVTGWLAQSAGLHLPGGEGVFSTTNPIDAVFTVGPNAWAQLMVGIGFLEYQNHNGKLSMVDMHDDKDREVGSFTNPLYGAKILKGKSDEYLVDIKTKELKNGRLAMLAIGGLVHQTIIQGSNTFGPFPNPDFWHPYLELNVFRQ